MGISQYILSIDLGTSNVKVALVGEEGDIAASTARPVETRHVPSGGAEQEPEEIWAAILSASKQVVHEAGRPSESIVGATCASQYNSLIAIDESGRSLASMLLWVDRRGGPHALELYGANPQALPRWLEVSGMPPLPTGGDSLSKMMLVKNEWPDLYERTYKFVEPADFITTRLSGVCATNPCTAFSMLLTDNRRLEAVDYHEELLGMSGIERKKLPDLVPIGSSLGRIRKDVADEIGLSPRTQVFSGVNDTQAVAIGTGVFRPGVGGINVGTTCQVLAFVGAKAADVENFIVSMPSPIPGRYMVLAENEMGARALDHFLRDVVFTSDALADHSVADPFAGVERALESTPAGSGNLLYLPWLTGSQPPSLNPLMRGAFLNLSLETTRERMVRSVLEGVSFSLRWLLPVVERLVEEHFDALRFAGGGAASDQWSQIMADVMKRPVLQLADAGHVNNRATALLGFEQLGLVSLDEVDRFCPIEHSYEPKAENLETYERLFEQFVACYEQTRPIFEALNG